MIFASPYLDSEKWYVKHYSSVLDTISDLSPSDIQMKSDTKSSVSHTIF